MTDRIVTLHPSEPRRRDSERRAHRGKPSPGPDIDPDIALKEVEEALDRVRRELKTMDAVLRLERDHLDPRPPDS